MRVKKKENFTGNSILITVTDHLTFYVVSSATFHGVWENVKESRLIATPPFKRGTSSRLPPALLSYLSHRVGAVPFANDGNTIRHCLLWTRPTDHVTPTNYSDTWVVLLAAWESSAGRTSK